MDNSLIKRQDAIDEMKRISFSRWFECGEYLTEDTREIEIINSNKALEVIEALPSAEPKIIRCKECRFAHLTYDGDCKYCDKWTDEFGIPEELYLDGDFFCGYAERRTDE